MAKDGGLLFDYAKAAKALIDESLFENMGNRVVCGPFCGMEIPKITPWFDGNNGTKLLGLYEIELRAAIERALQRKPQVIVNLGCAEGYYTIGLALRAPWAKVVGRDLAKDSLALCRDYAQKNGVSARIDLDVGCDQPEQLSIAVAGTTGHRFYVVDVEGWETDLLVPERCPELRDADIIVECHEFLEKGKADTLIERFMHTHEIEVIEQQSPIYGAHPQIICAHFVRAMMVSEVRPHESNWLAMWAKNGR